MTPPGAADALDDELRSWIEGTFLQFRGLEQRLAGAASSPGVSLSRPRARRAAPRQQPRAARPPTDRSSDRAEADRDVPRRVLEFAPKRIRSVDDDDVADHTGGAIVARLRQAAGQFHAAEDRIDQLQTEIEQVENRAVRAEAWLQLIRQEIEEKLIAKALGMTTLRVKLFVLNGLRHPLRGKPFRNRTLPFFFLRSVFTLAVGGIA